MVLESVPLLGLLVVDRGSRVLEISPMSSRANASGILGDTLSDGSPAGRFVPSWGHRGWLRSSGVAMKMRTVLMLLMRAGLTS